MSPVDLLFLLSAYTELLGDSVWGISGSCLGEEDEHQSTSASLRSCCLVQRSSASASQGFFLLLCLLNQKPFGEGKSQQSSNSSRDRGGSQAPEMRVLENTTSSKTPKPFLPELALDVGSEAKTQPQLQLCSFRRLPTEPLAG